MTLARHASPLLLRRGDNTQLLAEFAAAQNEALELHQAVLHMRTEVGFRGCWPGVGLGLQQRWGLLQRRMRF